MQWLSYSAYVGDDLVLHYGVRVDYVHIAKTDTGNWVLHYETMDDSGRNYGKRTHTIVPGDFNVVEITCTPLHSNGVPVVLLRLVDGECVS